MPVQLASATMVSGGVSSFGYGGTIAHAVLAFASGGSREVFAIGCVPESSEALAFGTRGAEAAGKGVGAKCLGVGTGHSTFERRSRLLLLCRRRAFPWRDPPHPFAQRGQAGAESSHCSRRRMPSTSYEGSEALVRAATAPCALLSAPSHGTPHSAVGHASPNSASHHRWAATCMSSCMSTCMSTTMSTACPHAHPLHIHCMSRHRARRGTSGTTRPRRSPGRLAQEAAHHTFRRSNESGQRAPAVYGSYDWPAWRTMCRCVFGEAGLRLQVSVHLHVCFC
ncbi:hypothetical protein OAO87_00655 [bacterium]|nr:hypothetical protein [bacterium]